MFSQSQPEEIYSDDAVLLRRRAYQDNDIIVTLLTSERGIISAIAKNARKSVKRFSGVLELFSNINVVIKNGHAISYLEEATIENPFEEIRIDPVKIGYASYFSEIISRFCEENQPLDEIYTLLQKVLKEISCNRISPEVASIVFQSIFLDDTGHFPEFTNCIKCGYDFSESINALIFFDIRAGGLICGKCKTYNSNLIVPMSLGTLRLLQWVLGGTTEEAFRLKFPKRSVRESMMFLETFLPYHLGKEPFSLSFLKKIRNY